MASSATSASTTTTAAASSDALTTTTTSKKGSSKDSEENNFGGLGTLGVAASQAASLGMNQASKFHLYKGFKEDLSKDPYSTVITHIKYFTNSSKQ